MADGTRCRVVRIDAGRGLRAHLMAMGLRPGAAVRVVKNGGAGPFVLAMQALRLVLGRGMAHRIHVVREGGGAESGGDGGRE
jgi:Fe2+ transport system protein FeoA